MEILFYFMVLLSWIFWVSYSIYEIKKKVTNIENMLLKKLDEK